MITPLETPIGRLLVEAGHLAMASWRTLGLDVSDKAGRGSAPDLVSEVDLAVNTVISDGLRALHPGLTIVSEEAEVVHGAPDDAFVLDPIDGTHNYLAGSSLWTIALARTRGTEVEEAWIYHPPTGELSHASRTETTTHAGQPVQVSAKPPNRGLVSVSLTQELLPLLMHADHFAGIRALGSSAICLAAAARGEFLIHAGGGKPWDVAAGFLLAEQAGGQVVDLAGNARNPFEAKKSITGAPQGIEAALAFFP
ncbi:MAG: inositol monophosphatase [Deltaproteobacteria bacterium]|nr:inositol monophosphatase [Deltaproteobacteria bacterium]